MTFVSLGKKASRQSDNKTTIQSSKLKNKEEQYSLFGSPSFGNQNTQWSINSGFNFGNVSIYDKIQHKENTCPCGGGCPRCNIQAKLKVSQPDDKYEQEADNIADQVMRMPSDQISRKCSGCQMENEEEMKISRHADGIGDLQVSDSVAQQIDGIKGGGKPLDDSTRIFMESRFGFDFSKVRIHIDERAVQTSKDVNALAYTVGNDVMFGEGQYRPTTREGRRLLAHELVHVVQNTSDVALQRLARQVAPNAGTTAPLAWPESCTTGDIPTIPCGNEPPINKKMADLDPTFRPNLQAMLDDLAARHIPFRVAEGFRTRERQQWLYESCRCCRPGPWKTNADGVRQLSNHQGDGNPGSGKAADCYPRTSSGSDDDPAWNVLEAAAHRHGLFTGNHWANRDPDHVSATNR